MAMPMGDVWKVKIHLLDGLPAKAELPNKKFFNITKVGGTYKFKFTLEGADRKRLLQQRLETEYRCCCDNQDSCKWYAKELLTSGDKCPYLYSIDGKIDDGKIYGGICTSNGGTWYNYFKKKSKYEKLSHSRRRSAPKHECKITLESHAYFDGKKCPD